MHCPQARPPTHCPASQPVAHLVMRCLKVCRERLDAAAEVGGSSLEAGQLALPCLVRQTLHVTLPCQSAMGAMGARGVWGAVPSGVGAVYEYVKLCVHGKQPMGQAGSAGQGQPHLHG
jgi:hypothetical protein